MLIKVFKCFEHAEQASSRGVLEGGGGATSLLNKGGGNRFPGLVVVEFPQELDIYTLY